MPGLVIPTRQVVDIADFPKAFEKAMRAIMREAQIALKIEAGVALGEELAATQRVDTGRLRKSTTVVGKRPIPHDPGAGFHMPPSKAEMMNSAESTIPPDDPGDPAHVIEAAGAIEGRAYGSYVEARFRTAERAIASVEAKSGPIVARAEKRADKRLAQMRIG